MALFGWKQGKPSVSTLGKNLAMWVQRLKEGDQSAFLPLYQNTAPGLMRFLMWKTGGDRPLCEDVLQEAFVRFLTHLDKIESTETLAVQAYLLQVVKNCWIDKAGRSPQAKRPHVGLDSLMDQESPEETLRQERAVEMRELKVALQSLGERESEIVWLRDAMGMSHKEVAEHVGISEVATRQAYVRAKKALIACVGVA